MEEIILTIQKTGNPNFEYRFGVSVSDSMRYFRNRNCIVVIKILSEIFITETTCGQFVFNESSNCLKIRKGYDLYSQEISEFIKKNKWAENKDGVSFNIHMRSKGIFLDYKNVNTKKSDYE